LAIPDQSFLGISVVTTPNPSGPAGVRMLLNLHFHASVADDFSPAGTLQRIIQPNLGFGDDLVMFLAASLLDACARRSLRAGLVLAAICVLSVSLATRYTVQGSEAHSVKIVKSQSSDAQRQHLVRDALKWTAPVAKFTLLPAVRSSVHVVSAVFSATNLSSESWLYNRPPPSC
jgi:hypothetical protein